MKKEFLNEEMTYVAPSMKVVELMHENELLSISTEDSPIDTGNEGGGNGPIISD